MRTIKQCMNLEHSTSMTKEEYLCFREWLDTVARYTMDSDDFCCWIGWFTLDEFIPISPKEAGFK